MPATTRRAFLPTAGAAAGTAFVPRWLDAAPKLRLTGCELLPVRASDRTVWLIVGLRTDVGLTGLGEASDAFGCANTTREDAARMETELRGLFELVKGQSPVAPHNPSGATCSNRPSSSSTGRLPSPRGPGSAWS